MSIEECTMQRWGQYHANYQRNIYILKEIVDYYFYISITRGEVKTLSFLPLSSWANVGPALVEIHVLGNGIATFNNSIRDNFLTITSFGKIHSLKKQSSLFAFFKLSECWDRFSGDVYLATVLRHSKMGLSMEIRRNTTRWETIDGRFPSSESLACGKI